MIISVKEIKKYISCILIPLFVGLLSSLLTSFLSGLGTDIYYNDLIKPQFAPPAIIFPIVWTILYILMGTSAYIILSSGKSEEKIKGAMFYYWLQLALNFLWSILYFGLQLRFTALIDLLLILVFVVIMVYKFYKIEPKAAFLNIPYILWLIYAFVLNYFTWFLNK